MDRYFHIGDLLSLKTQVICTPNGFSGLMDLVYYMLHLDYRKPKKRVPAHSVLIAACKPDLVNQHNWLVRVPTQALLGDENDNARGVIQFAVLYGEYHRVERLSEAAVSRFFGDGE